MKRSQVPVRFPSSHGMPSRACAVVDPLGERGELLGAQAGLAARWHDAAVAGAFAGGLCGLARSLEVQPAALGATWFDHCVVATAGGNIDATGKNTGGGDA